MNARARGSQNSHTERERERAMSAVSINYIHDCSIQEMRVHSLFDTFPYGGYRTRGLYFLKDYHNQLKRDAQSERLSV
jgi:hypothetical protein